MNIPSFYDSDRVNLYTYKICNHEKNTFILTCFPPDMSFC